LAWDKKTRQEPTVSRIGNVELSLIYDGYGAYLELSTSGSPPVSPSNTGRLIYNTVTDTFQVSQNGDAYTDILDVGVPTSRILTAGAGLTGGGTLASDLIFNVVANADGSIVVNANDIQVGTLANDTQHGNRGGGSLHPDAIAAGNSGFMSGADKTKLDGLPSSAVPTTRTVTAGTGLTGGGSLSSDVTLNVTAHADGSIVVAADSIQVGVLASDSQHGNRGGGGLHASATTSVAGFMSAADKTKLDGLPSSVVNGGVVIWGNNSVLASTAIRYLTPGYTDNSAPTTVIQFRCPAACTAQHMYVRHGTPNGNGNNIVYTLRKNGVATTLAVTMASTSADGSNTVNVVSISQGDLLDIEVTKPLSIGTTPANIVVAIELRAV
jgi:hypothetical protein